MNRCTITTQVSPLNAEGRRVTVVIVSPLKGEQVGTHIDLSKEELSKYGDWGAVIRTATRDLSRQLVTEAVLRGLL